MLKPGEQVALWSISVDTREESTGFSQKIAADGRGPIAFPLLSDPRHRVIDAYGVQDPRYVKLKREGIPYPAVYLIDKSGKVAWMKIEKDYTQHFPNSEIRAALDALK